jgi:hypothetical protein
MALPKHRTAGIHRLRRKTLAVPPTRYLDLQHTRRIRLQQHSAVGVRDDDGMIEHRGQHGFQRKL